MQDTIRAYIAGFLDGDGSIHFQLVRRRDYVYGYQIRVSVCFYQSTRGKAGLEWLKEQLGCGYLRDRAGDMSDYTIVRLVRGQASTRTGAAIRHFQALSGGASAGVTLQAQVACYAREIPRKRKAG